MEIAIELSEWRYCDQFFAKEDIAIDIFANEDIAISTFANESNTIDIFTNGKCDRF